MKGAHREAALANQFDGYSPRATARMLRAMLIWKSTPAALCAPLFLLVACSSEGASSGSAQPSASAPAKSSASASSASAAPAPSASASGPDELSIGTAVPAPPALGKAGEGFASAEDAAAAVAHAVASEDLTAFEVGRPTKELLATTFIDCNPEKMSISDAMDMKPGMEAGLKLAKGKRPLKAMRQLEADPIELKKGEEYAYCKVASDLKLRVFGFLIHDADGKDAFDDGGIGVSIYPLGAPPRYYIGSPK